MIRGNDPILLTPGPLTTSLETKQAMLRDWGSWDASFNAITASICKDLVDVVNGAGTHVCVPLQGSGTFSVEAALAQPGAARRQGAGAAERRLLPAHREDPQVPRPRARGARHRRGQASDRRDGRGGARARPGDHARGAGALRDRHRDPEPARRDRRGVRAPRQGPHRRRDELVRRDRDRRVEVPDRRGGRRLGQVHRGPARHGLRDRAPGGAREVPGQLALARDGPLRPVDLHAEDHAVALHAAHARGGRLPRGARPVQGRGRGGRARRALPQELRHADRGHGGARLAHLPAARGAGAGHRHLPRARRSRPTPSSRSTRR